MLEGNLYSGRLAIVSMFCLKEVAGGGMAGGGRAYNPLLRYVTFSARLLKVMTDWVQALV